MNIANTAPDGEPLAFDVPLLSGLLPGLVSVIALMAALLALEFRSAAHALLPLLVVQGSLLALGAAVLALAAHDRLSQWESRAAPQSARDRVRAGLRGRAWRMGAIGMAGPVVLALVAAWRRDEWALLCSALAVPAVCLCAGLFAVLSWHGRAPRLLLLPALAVLALLLGLPQEGVLGGAWQLAAAAAVAALLWLWLNSRRALAVLAPPLPSPRPIAWLRRTAAYQNWRVTSGMEPSAAVRKYSDRYRVMGMLLPLLWLPQMIGQGDRPLWFSWGTALDGAYDGLIYAGCLMIANTIAAVCIVMPSLHWRRRLAPGGMSPERWAVRRVLGSMAAAAALVTVAFGLALLFRSSGSAGVTVGIWLSLMGDVLLASSVLHWLHGRRSKGWQAALAMVATPVLGALLVYALVGLGVTPRRGPEWLALQLALVVPATLAAIRRWSQRDLNNVD